MKILNTVIKVVHVGNNTRFAVGTPGVQVLGWPPSSRHPR